jgi:glycosyltransferase involved in cell wall biosynthesis
MTRLRILHTESSQGWGGQEIRILTESAGMLARGHAVTILACPNSNILHAAKAHNVPAVALPIEKKRLGGLFSMRTWLRAHAGDFDVINTHSSTDSWLVALGGLGLTGMPPLVRTRHVSTVVPDNWPTRWLYLRATRHVVTTGERLRQTLHRVNRFPLEHITSVPTGIDLGRYRPGAASEARLALGLVDRPSVGIVATLRSWKGHEDLLDAWSRLGARRQNWQLVIVGDGPQRANIEAQIARLKLADCVFRAGNRDDVERWLQAFDLFVLPSYGNEGVPQGIMQAMAAGLPVISTRVGAIDEAVVDGETGVLIAARDVAKLAETLEVLLRDGERRARYAAAALAYAQRHFGIEPMLDSMENVFRNTCRPPRVADPR